MTLIVDMDNSRPYLDLVLLNLGVIKEAYDWGVA